MPGTPPYTRPRQGESWPRWVPRGTPRRGRPRKPSTRWRAALSRRPHSSAVERLIYKACGDGLDVPDAAVHAQAIHLPACRASP
jgi:hypothetical protein